MSVEINLFQPVAVKEKRHNGNTVREVFLNIMICSFKVKYAIVSRKKTRLFFSNRRGAQNVLHCLVRGVLISKSRLEFFAGW